jgi:hypothetical protein
MWWWAGVSAVGSSTENPLAVLEERCGLHRTENLLLSPLPCPVTTTLPGSPSQLLGNFSPSLSTGQAENLGVSHVSLYTSLKCVCGLTLLTPFP